MCFILGGLVVDFFFYRYKESFAYVAAADVNMQEHLFHYGIDLLLLLLIPGRLCMVKCHSKC